MKNKYKLITGKNLEYNKNPTLKRNIKIIKIYMSKLHLREDNSQCKTLLKHGKVEKLII